MIDRCTDWATLLSAVRDSQGLRIEASRETALRAVLAGPCAIAWWIAQRAGDLGRRGSLSVLIAGAEAADAPDEGRWYQLLPVLLGAEFTVEVTLVGRELETGFRSSVAAHAPEKPASLCRMDLEAFLAARVSPTDVAFAFHPGVQKHRAWLEEGGFPALLRRGVPLVCAAYGADEQEMERWVVEAYGFDAGAAPLVNPFYLELSDAGTEIRWASVLWEIHGAPARNASPDTARLARLDNLNRMVMHSMTHGGGAAPPYGVSAEFSSGAGKRLRLLHVADNRFVDPDTGKVMHAHDGTLEVLKRIPAEVAKTFPGDGAPEIDRAAWAAAVKAEHLLETYPESPAIADGTAVAADMRAALKDRVARMFAGRS